MIDGLARLFFEDLTLLLVAEFAALAVVLGIHRRRFTAKTRRGIWITLAVCAALIAVQFAVSTDREQIKDLIKTLADAVDRGDLTTIEDGLDENFESENNNKQQYMALVKKNLQRWQIDEAKVRKFEIELQGKSATVTFSAWCDARNPKQVYYSNRSQWRLECVKGDIGWKVAGIKLLKINLTNISGINDLMQF